MPTCLGFPLLLFFILVLPLEDARSASLPKCTEVANFVLKSAGFPEVKTNYATAEMKPIAGAALELTRERYRAGNRPDYRWLEAEAKPKPDSARIFAKGNRRAVVFAVGDEDNERITQVVIQGNRFGVEGEVSTRVRFDASCKIVEFVTDPQDLGYPMRSLILAPKHCAPVFKAEAARKVPGSRKGFTFEAARALLPLITTDDPTMVEALGNRPDDAFVSDTLRLYDAKLALCRKFITRFSDPSGLLKSYIKPEMRDGGSASGRPGPEKKSGGA